jgi:hypothetical protein
MRYNSIENLIGCSHVGGLLASLRAGLLLNIVILSARESTAMVSLDTADAASSSLNLAAILLHHDLSSILLILCLILLAELGAEVVRDEFEYEGSDPGSETKAAGNEPVVSVKATTSDLHGIASELHDDALGYSDKYEDDAESEVVEDAFEDVDLIVDYTSIDNVEDAHHDENIEDIG